jgi:UDP-N-acetylmuramoyl-tripeptide--D-alanyl-D-alanine ligase
MEGLLLKDVVLATGGTLIQGDPAIVIDSVSTDSRDVKSGDLFIALKGERFDGHDFIGEAVNKGVKAVVTSLVMNNLPINIGVVLVKDTLIALQDIAAFYRRLFDVPITAITGSTGKTTTKDMIHTLLAAKFNVLKSEGNLNNQIGLPLTLFKLNGTHQMAVVEMGMSGFNEISRLTAIAEPTLGVITNIGLSHIENLGSRENILKAKLELFERFDKRCTAILNADDDLLWGLKSKLSFPVIYYGTKNGIALRAENIESLNGKGISYTLHTEGEKHRISLSVPGRHNVYNSMAAVATARYFGVEFEHILSAFQNLRTHKMRLEITSLKEGITVIDDAYNASPDSVVSAISVLKDLPGKRKIAILGDMLELGDYSEYAHSFVGKAVFNNGIDTLITKGDLSRVIATQAQILGMGKDRVFSLDSNADVKFMLETFVESGDTILVKGSRGMKMEEIVMFFKTRWGK